MQDILYRIDYKRASDQLAACPDLSERIVQLAMSLRHAFRL